MFTRKGHATSVSGKTANGCPVRSAEPPDNMDFHFISPCGAKLCEADTKKGRQLAIATKLWADFLLAKRAETW